MQPLPCLLRQPGTLSPHHQLQIIALPPAPDRRLTGASVMPPPCLDFSLFEFETGASIVRLSRVDRCDLSALGPGCHPSHGLQSPRGSIHACD
ncbi:hypothetical protein E2562_003729 [Oryza meyeriana var. granulata]|uniref:Uncharacterized protein n=1 Tax=Oryza meyeriana var. granulata TaxID=110450 RepID=A0A6G1C2G2_9ORYZ|nr:hypothetical protein E2562_003729 [Oryza meyeriana var. granulata]